MEMEPGIDERAGYTDLSSQGQQTEFVRLRFFPLSLYGRGER